MPCARRAALKLPHYGILPAVLSGNDYLVTMPSRLGDIFERMGGIRCVELPVHLPAFEIRVLWHARHHGSSANARIRRVAVDTLNKL